MLEAASAGVSLDIVASASKTVEELLPGVPPRVASRVHFELGGTPEPGSVKLGIGLPQPGVTLARPPEPPATESRPPNQQQASGATTPPTASPAPPIAAAAATAAAATA